LMRGAGSLSTHELLAILLRTGSKDESVLDLARRVLTKIETLDQFSELAPGELTTIKGIGPTKAVEILAAVELGRRITNHHPDRKVLSSPEDIYVALKDELIHAHQEQLVALFLNVKSELIAKRTMFVGTINGTLIHPREIYKWAYKHSAYAIILVHNHPSGDPTPSKEDIEMTRTLLKVGETMGIRIIDHVIIARKGFYSIVTKHFHP